MALTLSARVPLVEAAAAADGTRPTSSRAVLSESPEGSIEWRNRTTSLHNWQSVSAAPFSFFYSSRLTTTILEWDSPRTPLPGEPL